MLLNVFSDWKTQACLWTPVFFCVCVWIKLVGRSSLKKISRQIKLTSMIPSQAPTHTMLLSGLTFSCYKSPLNQSCHIYGEGSEAQFHAAASVMFFIDMILLVTQPLQIWKWLLTWPLLTLHVACLSLPCIWCRIPLVVACQNSPALSPSGS